VSTPGSEPAIEPWQRTALAELETIAGRDVGRGIGPLADAARGGLQQAALSIARHPAPHVALLTGFFVPRARPPAAETDGPPGAAQLAAGLARAGVPVWLVTDELCADAVAAAWRAAAAGLGLPPAPSPIETVPLRGRARIAELLAAWRSAEPPLSHAIAVERVGPAADGVPHNMRGEDISRWTAPLHLLFQGGGHASIGIGDGGNELGMGVLPPWLVAQHVDHGDRIACAVAADHLLVCGVSNWGAWALAAALAILRPAWRAALVACLQPALAEQVLARTVEEGPAVDGMLGRQEPSVDGLARPIHAAVLEKLLAVVARCAAAEAGAAAAGSPS
jgi:hypothetical protein